MTGFEEVRRWVAAGLLVFPAVEAATVTGESEPTCWEYTTTMRLVVIDIDQKPVPGATFNVEYPVCVDGVGAPGGHTTVTTDVTGNALFPLPYVEVSRPLRDLDWNVNASYIRETSPVAEAHWKSMGYHPAFYDWHLLRWHEAYGDDGNVSEYLFVWMRTGGFLAANGEELEEQPVENTGPTATLTAPPADSTSMPVPTVDPLHQEGPAAESGGVNPSSTDVSTNVNDPPTSRLRVTEPAVSSTSSSGLPDRNAVQPTPAPRLPPIANGSSQTSPTGAGRRSSDLMYAAAAMSAAALWWLSRRRR